VLPTSKGGGLLNRRWGMEGAFKPSSCSVPAITLQYGEHTRATRSRRGGGDGPAGKAVHGWRRGRGLHVACADVKGLGVPPCLGTARPREGASGPDAEAAYGARGRAGALERRRRRGLPYFFRTGTI
jgi:hypothetical protein